jgi:plasmid stability protein
MPAATTTLTIRNLDEAVKHKLRVRAAANRQSMQAEVREILMRAVRTTAQKPPADAEGKFDSVLGIWAGRMTTREPMELTRGG